MAKYRIPQEAAHMIAVGLYHQIGTFLSIAKRDNPDDYERFKTDYLTRKAAPVKRRQSRNRRTPIR